MNEEKRLIQFKNLIFKGYKNSDNYDYVLFQLLRCREILMNENYLFTKQSAKRQYDLCSSIVLMTIHTSMQEVRKFKILSEPKKDNSDLTHSLINGYVEPSKIELKEPVRKLLK